MMIDTDGNALEGKEMGSTSKCTENQREGKAKGRKRKWNEKQG